MERMSTTGSLHSRGHGVAHLTVVGADARYTQIGALLTEWYAANCEPLPWRLRLGDPYAVWVAEVMLQQTQVKTVIPYYEAWLKRFPTVFSLAEAPLDDVLRMWQGLGYYGRARRMHEAARALVSQHGGAFPRTVASLKRLPGIGQYTAAAVACLAWGALEAPIDTNAVRVLSRIEGWDGSQRSSDVSRAANAVWRKSAPEGRASEFGQALMDLGRRICRPTRPACLVCPAALLCRARAADSVARCSPRRRRAEREETKHVAIIAFDGDTCAVRKRPDNGLWGGLWEFPRWVAHGAAPLEAQARDHARNMLGTAALTLRAMPVVRHAVTKYAVTLQAFVCTPREGTSYCRGQFPRTEWLPWHDVLQLPMPSPQVRLRTLVQEMRLEMAKSAD